MDDIYVREPENKRVRTYRRAPRRKRFSATEIRHLLISTVLVILVSISLMGGPPLGFIEGFAKIVLFVSAGYWWYPVSIITIFIASFMIHEFSHKFMAQHYGLWSEFRMTTQGYYLSAIAILFSFPIFGTGVMYSSGTRSVKEDGMINVAGPLSNTVLASIFAGASLVMAGAFGGIAFPLGFVFMYVIQLNAILGLFNMIPIQPFDGATVLHWNKIVWVIVTAALATLLLFGYFVLPAML